MFIKNLSELRNAALPGCVQRQKLYDTESLQFSISEEYFGFIFPDSDHTLKGEIEQFLKTLWDPKMKLFELVSQLVCPGAGN